MGQKREIWARASRQDGSLKCLTTAVEGRKLLSVHGKTQQMLYPMVIWRAWDFSFLFRWFIFGNWRNGGHRRKLGESGQYRTLHSCHSAIYLRKRLHIWSDLIRRVKCNGRTTRTIWPGLDVPKNNFKKPIFCTRLSDTHPGTGNNFGVSRVFAPSETDIKGCVLCLVHICTLLNKPYFRGFRFRVFRVVLQVGGCRGPHAPPFAR
jgi:hypothetical protein